MWETGRRSRSKVHSIKKNSVLWRDPRGYEVEEHPYMYKLSKLYHKQELEVDYIDSMRLINRIVSSRANIASVAKDGKYRFLGKYFNPAKLTIDFDKAMNLCQERYQSHRNYGLYLFESSHIQDFTNGVFNIQFNPHTDGRLHSNFTQIPKIYRKYILYDGKLLVEVDISNSILYFFSMYLNSITNKVSINKEYILKIYTNTNKPLLPLMLGKRLESLDIQEVSLLKNESINGVFYDNFNECP